MKYLVEFGWEVEADSPHEAAKKAKWYLVDEAFRPLTDSYRCRKIQEQ